MGGGILLYVNMPMLRCWQYKKEGKMLKKSFKFFSCIFFLCFFVGMVAPCFGAPKQDELSFKVDEVIKAPIFKTDSSGFDPYSVKVTGGVAAQFVASAPNQVIYYGILDYDSYWAGLYNTWLRTSNGKKWNTADLIAMSKTTDNKGSIKFTEPGRYYAYAVATEGNKSSKFEVVEIVLRRSDTLNLTINNGNLSTEFLGELYASLSPDMDNSKKIKNGPVSDEFIGETVYFQRRNVNGCADSEVWSQYIEPLRIESPSITTKKINGGIVVEIKKPSVRLGNSIDSPYVDSSEVHVYYTTDGTNPIPGKSDEYLDQVTIINSGTYNVKAIATYKKSISAVAGSNSWFGGTMFTLNATKKPKVSVSGFDISIKSSDPSDSLFMKINDGEYRKLDSNYVVLDKSYEGNTLQICSGGLGEAYSDPVILEIKTLQDFQTTYSDRTRQFGYWIVSEVKNQYNGRPTGEYSLYARFPMGGDNRYIFAVASIDGDGFLTQMIISTPCVEGNPGMATFIGDTPYSLSYDVGDGEKTVFPEVYNVNTYTYSATYYLLLSADDNKELFELISSDKDLTVVATLQEEMTFMDAMGVLSTASQYTNYEAVGNALYENIKANLSENQFILSNEGFLEAIEYLTQVKSK